MKQFNNILCVVDPEATSESALERAVALAESNQAILTVATVIYRVPERIRLPDVGMAADLQARLMEAQAQWLETLIEPYRDRARVDSMVLVGTSFLEVIRTVLRNEHDLVVKSPESPDWLNRLFSSDDMNLLRKCPCPVWMVKPEAGGSYQRILAAVDVDGNYPPAEVETRQALNGLVMEIAGALAVSEFAELHVVNAWQATGESALRHSAFMSKTEDEVDAYVEQSRRHHEQRLDELMREAGEMLGPDAMDFIKLQLHLPNGSARREIPALAKRLQVDCIVMGTVARTGIRGFIMGNTAETILDQIDCSVLAVKPPGFITPVMLDE